MSVLEEKITRAFMAGLGGVVLTGEKLEALKSKLMKENKMNEKEAKGLIEELVESGEGRWKELEKTAKEMLRKRLDTMDVPNRRELEEMKSRVESLERRIAALETASSRSE